MAWRKHLDLKRLARRGLGKRPWPAEEAALGRRELVLHLQGAEEGARRTGYLPIQPPRRRGACLPSRRSVPRGPKEGNASRVASMPALRPPRCRFRDTAAAAQSSIRASLHPLFFRDWRMRRAALQPDRAAKLHRRPFPPGEPCKGRNRGERGGRQVGWAPAAHRTRARPKLPRPGGRLSDRRSLPRGEHANDRGGRLRATAHRQTGATSAFGRILNEPKRVLARDHPPHEPGPMAGLAAHTLDAGWVRVVLRASQRGTATTPGNRVLRSNEERW